MYFVLYFQVYCHCRMEENYEEHLNVQQIMISDQDEDDAKISPASFHTVSFNNDIHRKMRTSNRQRHRI